MKNLTNSTSKQDTELRERIVEHSRRRFMQYGFSSVTTDELAAELGISKKTLYKHFRSKEDLLRVSLLEMMQETELLIKGTILDSDLSFVQKLKKLIATVRKRIAPIQLPLIRDMQRLAPSVWSELEEFRRRVIVGAYRDVIRSGVDEGIISRDTDHELLMIMLRTLMDGMINPQVMSDMSHSVSEVYEFIMDVIFVGILTDNSRIEYMENNNSRNAKIDEEL